jgi:uncharacterized protein YgiM (DUF1202 family)
MRTTKIHKAIGGAVAALLAGAAAITAATTVQAQTLIPGVTGCSAPGNKQAGGAIVGALVGGLVGNKVGGHHATGETVIGAAAGAAAGSAIGCQMQKSSQNTAANNAPAANAAPTTPNTYAQNGYRLSSWVSPASYSPLNDTLVASSIVNLRAAPSATSQRVGSLQAGESFEALAKVRGSDWILVGQNGVGVGYVNGAYARRAGYRQASY